MQISGIGSVSMINNVSSVQNKTTGEFAEHLERAAEKAQESKDDAKLKETCKDMEAMFLNMLMTNMRNTVQKSSLVDTSQEDIMTSMLDTEMTKNMANAGGVGLADMLYRQLSITASATKKNQAPK